MTGIIILNYNTPDDVMSCVRSIYNETQGTDFRIYIVDNASKDNSVEIIEQFCREYPEISFLQSGENNGFSAGNNIGIKAAIKDECEYICLINADVLLLNDAISIAVNKLKQDQEIGIVAPIIVTKHPDAESQFARNKLTLASYLSEKTFLKKSAHFSKKHRRYQKRGEFDSDYKFFGMTYGCMYIGYSSFFQKTNFLDESVFLFNEEDIIAYKLEACNLQTLITPDAKILHNHHSSISKIGVAARVFHFRLSPLIVLRKYQGINNIALFGMVLANTCMWSAKSILNSEYRSSFCPFVKAIFKVFKFKRKEGLQNFALTSGQKS